MKSKWDGKSRITTKLYKDNYDRIFKKSVQKEKKENSEEKKKKGGKKTLVLRNKTPLAFF